MTESLFTISLAGFIAGFIFSMPIAGPISILITSNALKGRVRYCRLATVGSAIADFIYVYVAVYGLTRLYSLYKPVIPYVLFAGTVFLIFMGFKIYHTKFSLEKIEGHEPVPVKIKPQANGGFYAGFMINFFNPTLFFGWLTTSFLTISFVASMGLNTGGLYSMIDRNVQEINHIEGKKIEQTSTPYFLNNDTIQGGKRISLEELKLSRSTYFPIVVSGFYAFFLSLGSIAWFLILTFLLSRFRKYINVKVIVLIIRSLGIILGIIGLFFSYTAVKMLL